MPSVDNRVIIACAGSGKTTRLVAEALQSSERRIAIVTYTNNNVREIVKRFCEANSCVPRHVDVMTWFGFLMRECARPYQRAVYPAGRVDGLVFVNEQSARHTAEADIRRHYFGDDGRIYSDKIAKFVVRCQERSGQLVTRRLGNIYSDIFVDEFQDLAGWDLEFIRILMESQIRITLVGDPRQHIYSTHPSRKNLQYLGVEVVSLARKWERLGLCHIVEPMNSTFRCNQAICDFANRLWPGMDPMVSLAETCAELEGVFLVAERDIEAFLRRYNPRVLRHSKVGKNYGGDALNFGISKGLQFDYVLIVPTSPISKYLATGDLSHVRRARDKLHVAVTRAKYGVGFVFDGESPIVPKRFS